MTEKAVIRAAKRWARARQELVRANTKLAHWHRREHAESEGDPVARVAAAQAAFTEAEHRLLDALNEYNVEEGQ